MPLDDYIYDVVLHEAKLKINLKKGKLHSVLGIDEDKNVTDYSVSTLVNKAKKAIDSGKASYAEMVRMLNVVRVYNKNSNPSLADKIKSVQDKLKSVYKDNDNKSSKRKKK